MEWSEPYFDEGGGNIPMTTCSVPFYGEAGGRCAGVVMADVSLDWLTELVASIKVLKTGYSFLLSRNGTMLTHPCKEMIMNETIFSIAESRNNPPCAKSAGRWCVASPALSPIPISAASKAGCITRRSRPPAGLWRWYSPRRNSLPRSVALTYHGRLMGLAGILLLAAAVALIARSITTPLHVLAEATEVIASGNFDAELPPVRSNDEVGKLTQAFHRHEQSR